MNERHVSATNERQLRIDLAAAFRIVAKLGIHEAVANHFSAGRFGGLAGNS